MIVNPATPELRFDVIKLLAQIGYNQHHKHATLAGLFRTIMLVADNATACDEVASSSEKEITHEPDTQPRD